MSIEYYGSPWAIFMRECLWMVVGAIAFCGRRHAHRPRRSHAPAVLATLARSDVILLPACSRRRSVRAPVGASRWLGVGWLLRIQPSEFAKFAMCLYAAHVIAKKERRETEWGRVLAPSRS